MPGQHIVHLTSAHRAVDIRIFSKEAVSLARAGFQVSVVGVHDHDEIRQGVALLAIAPWNSRWRRMLLGPPKVLIRGLVAGGTAFHLHDPELLPVGFLLRALGKTVVYDVHEDVPSDILSKAWIPTPLRRVVAVAMATVQTVAAAAFSGVVAATPSIARRFPPRKTVIVENFPHVNELIAGSPEGPVSGPPTFIYVGGILEHRGLEQAVAAMGYLAPHSKASLVIAGELANSPLLPRLQVLRGWDRVQAVGYLTRGAVRDLMARATAGLVVFQPIPNHVTARPTKFFEYLSAGLPVIASNFPAWDDLLRETHAGRSVDPTSPEEIAQAMQWFEEHRDDAWEMGRRGRQAVLERYHWGSAEAVLVNFYRQFLRLTPGAPC